MAVYRRSHREIALLPYQTTIDTLAKDGFFAAKRWHIEAQNGTFCGAKHGILQNNSGTLQMEHAAVLVFNIRLSELSVDDIAVLIHIFFQTFLVGCHGTKAHTNVREATIVVQILHSYLLR